MQCYVRIICGLSLCVIPFWTHGERKRFLFVHVDFSRGYSPLNSMWTLWLFLRTWPHFHNFYFPCLRLGLYWPCASSGIFDYSYTQTWMQKPFLLIERLHRPIWEATWTVSRSVLQKMLMWPLCLFRRLKPAVTALKTGSLLDRNLNHFSHDMHTYCNVWTLQCLMVNIVDQIQNIVMCPSLKVWQYAWCVVCVTVSIQYIAAKRW